MDRRKFLAGALAVTSAAAVARIGGEAVWNRDDVVAYGERWLDHLREQHWRGDPASVVYAQHVKHAEELATQLDRGYSIEVCQGLRNVQARTLATAGTIAFLDLGQHAPAERHLRAALGAASESDDLRLCAWIYGKLGQRRLYDPNGDLYEALYMTTCAHDYTQGNDAVAANVLTKRAEIYAALGGERQARDCLDRAGIKMVSTKRDEIPAWIGAMQLARVEAFAGACWLRLGNATRATEALHAALADTSPEQSHEIIVLADSATASATLHEPEAAVSYLYLAIPVASTARGTERLARIRQARRALAPWDGERFVVELDERMRDAGLQAS